MQTTTATRTMSSALLMNSKNQCFALPSSLESRCRKAYGWNEDFCAKAIHGYLQFMKIKLQQEDYNCTILCPSKTVELVWQQHLLDVVHYVRACQEYTAGHLIGHNPDQALHQAEQIKATQLSLKALFGSIDEQVWNFGEEDTPEEEAEEESNNNSSSPSRKRRRVSEEASPEEMKVQFRQVEDGTECYFRMHPSTPLQRTFHYYAKQRGVPVAALRFVLDGEEVDPSETPQDLELEPDDVILVGHLEGTWLTAGTTSLHKKSNQTAQVVSPPGPEDPISF